MNKKEARTFEKKVLTECKIDPNSSTLLEPNSGDTISTGYKVQIKAVMQNECRLRLKEITKKNDLAIKEENNQIIIYKPKGSQITI
jgi:hypothetical protein